MTSNPWLVESLAAFNFLCCPECVYRSKEETSFQTHALQNHTQSRSLFLGSVIGDFLETTANQIEIKEELKPDSNDLDFNYSDPLTTSFIKQDVEEYEQENTMDICYDVNIEEISENGHENDETLPLKSGKHKCNICGEKFKSKAKKEKHLKEKHSDYACAQCSFKTHESKTLDKHIKLHKDGITGEGIQDSQSFKCKYCGERFRTDTARGMHVKTSHAKKYAKTSIKNENGNCEIDEEFTESNKHFTNSPRRKSKIKKSDEVKTDQYWVGKEVYFCHQCPVKRTTKENIRKHLNNSHGYSAKKYGIIECMNCGEKVEDTDLFLHYKNFHDTVPPGYTTETFDCQFCPKKLTSKKSLQTHLSIKHRDQKSSKKEISEKIKKVKSDKFKHQCNQCLEKFDINSTLIEHIIGQHGSKDCDNCNKPFTSYLEYDKHFRENHNLHCEICKTKGVQKKVGWKRYESRFELEKHIESFHNSDGKPVEYKCEECSKVYINSLGLITHYKTMHNKVPPGYSNQHLCDTCAKVFTNKSNLSAHMKRMHPTENQAPSYTKNYDKGKPRKKNYRPETRMGNCPHCNKLYRTREGLKEHILVVHEKSTPFHCDECPRKFGIQFKLQSHKLIVHSKKNCEICGQQAYNAFELTRHKAAAHGIVPKDVYLCDTCPLFFKHPRNLAKHKETKHPQ